MKKILIVDDHSDIRKLIRMTLEFEDYEIHEAPDGVSALEMARRLTPDLVLLDVMMPGELDGLQTCRRLRADAGHPGLRILMLSAMGQSRDREAGLQAGADRYMVKPFSPLQLIDCIAGLWVAA